MRTWCWKRRRSGRPRRFRGAISSCWSRPRPNRRSGPRCAGPPAFVLGYARAHLLIEWGIQPQTCIGRGVGEHAAACITGEIGLAEGARRVAAGGRDDLGPLAGATDAVVVDLGTV